MGDRNDTNPVSPRGERFVRRPSDACADDDVLGRVLHVASNDSPDADVVADALDELVSALGLSRASLATIRNVDDVRRLDPVAAAGEHASFARDMPAVPLEQMAEAAIVVTERRALYVEDVHGLGERDAERDTGVGRWRTGMSTQAHAVLPVITRGSVIGVLTVQWSTPQAFTAEERHSLEAVALLFGLIMESAGAGVEPSVEAPPGLEEPVGVDDLPSGAEVYGYTVAAGGAVLPSTPGDSDAEHTMQVTVAGVEATSNCAAFWDVFGAGDGSVVILAGTVRAPRGGAHALAEAASHALRGACLRGSAPAAALVALNSWLLESGPGNAWVSVGCWRFNPANRSVSAAAAGSVATALFGLDGRCEVSLPETTALGAVAHTAPRDTFALALPGDISALCVGSVGWARADSGQRALAQLMSRAAETGVERVASRLLGIATDESVAPVVVLVTIPGDRTAERSLASRERG